jgi:hypothetical protein
MSSKRFLFGFVFVILVSILPLLLSVPGFGQDYYTFIRGFGERGPGPWPTDVPIPATAPGQFGYLWFIGSINGIATDSQNNVYVVDTFSCRVQKFDKSGNYLLSWGTQGLGDEQFSFPRGIAIDKNDNIYVTDTDRVTNVGRVRKFDTVGNYIPWGPWGTMQIWGPGGITCDTSGNIYVISDGGIYKFGPNGMLIGQFGGNWGNPSYPEEYQFLYALGIAVNKQGEIFITIWGDYGAGVPSQIRKYSADFQYLTRWYLDCVCAVAVDSDDNVLVCSNRDAAMGAYKYDSFGNLIQRIAPNGYPWEPGFQEFIHQPISICTDSEGHVYFFDLNFRVQKFAPPYVPYTFDGFFSPIENTPVVNQAKAGQTVPVKWRIVDKNGLPISDPASFVSLTSYGVNCATFAGDPTNSVEEVAAGSSGLQYQGDGWWQFNWKTSKAYKGQCRTMKLTLDDKSEHTASFSFK